MDKFYKNSKNKLFRNANLNKHGDLIEITAEEAANILAINNAPQPTSADKAKSLIDVAAGKARASLIAEGDLVEQEYALAEQEVIAWREAGSPSDAVPQSIIAWATATGMTDEQAAQGIESAAQSMRSVLLSIRAIRLAGKAAIDNASDNFDSVAQPFVDQLDQIRP